ncbi:E3 ubiquitin-protein ligase RNF181-like [Neodiprion pinetum]|uniref:E3 ubiquitin-protein ligase RNF181-like n=1 Tax=Neodiprion pinetum TaxID=441929 RepID=UPI00076FDECB|nr:E3 ubiquitin-protein ligase RNF181-like [Neodiprion pinetum]XP_046605224.1 E3 ubiquitin-protein ligase RNF181-like [Neodiprion virginianus]
MSDYFEEMGWTPLRDGEAPNSFLHMARLLRDFGMWDELGLGERLPPPASKEAISNLKDIKFDGNCQQCTVCLKDFDAASSIKSMPCRHSFHNECITPWLKKTNSCPLCRYELPTDDEDYELYKKEKKRAVQREEDVKSLHNSMFS